MDIRLGSYRITFLRLLALAASVASFFLWFGDWPSQLPADAHYLRRAASQAYFYSALLFVGSAAFACFSEHEYGYFPPSSLRPAAIVAGALLMFVSAAWMHSSRTAYLPPSKRPSTMGLARP